MAHSLRRLCLQHCWEMLRNRCSESPGGKGFSLPLTEAIFCSAIAPCAPEPSPYVAWVRRGAHERKENQHCSALSFACIVVEKGRTKYFLIPNLASSSLWKEVVQALCCLSGAKQSCLGNRATRSLLMFGCGFFLFKVGLGRCEGVMEQAQPCCLALLHALPRHLWTSCSFSKMP